jgi:hypothetical protein
MAAIIPSSGLWLVTVVFTASVQWNHVVFRQSLDLVAIQSRRSVYANPGDRGQFPAANRGWRGVSGHQDVSTRERNAILET